MYIMLNLINITQARKSLSSLIREVSSQKKRYVLIRDSIPQAVIVPYDEYQDQQENWQLEMKKIMSEGKKSFKKWLKKERIKTPKNEKQALEIINKTSRSN